MNIKSSLLSVANNPRPAGRGLILKTRLWLCSAILCLLVVSGCAEVKPWERGVLADYIMIPGRDSVGEMQKEHVFISREEATGGHSVGGSGCGCN